MKTVVVRNIKRTDADLVKRLGAFGVATAHEAYGRFGLMKPYLAPDVERSWAPAPPDRWRSGDNWMIHVAVEQCQPGDILVVGCTDNTDGMLAICSRPADGARRPQARHRAGVRDAKSLREMGFPVWSKAISTRARSRQRSVPSMFPWFVLDCGARAMQCCR
jgi:4-hydroxy-4-methyl-2-oxoglutarate aldolase